MLKIESVRRLQRRVGIDLHPFKQTDATSRPVVQDCIVERSTATSVGRSEILDSYGAHRQRAD
eukprot:m.14524 g.14524  ORF g.14524 m.14524 type:complete len:63 (-) comp10299_c0_seq1:89-277(-)